MKKNSLIIGLLTLLFITSCRDVKKEETELDETLDRIESVEQNIEETVDEVEKKAEEVEDALKELDNI